MTGCCPSPQRWQLIQTQSFLLLFPPALWFLFHSVMRSLEDRNCWMFPRCCLQVPVSHKAPDGCISVMFHLKYRQWIPARSASWCRAQQSRSCRTIFSTQGKQTFSSGPYRSLKKPVHGRTLWPLWGVCLWKELPHLHCLYYLLPFILILHLAPPIAWDKFILTLNMV